MLVGGVIHDEVEQHTDIALLRFGHEPVKVRHGAVFRSDSLVIADVVTEIDLRRREARSYPDGIDAELLEEVEMLGDAVEIAHTVGVGVTVAPRIDLINYRMPPPFTAGGFGGSRLGGRFL